MTDLIGDQVVADEKKHLNGNPGNTGKDNFNIFNIIVIIIIN